MTTRFSEVQLEAPPSYYSVDPDMQPAVCPIFLLFNVFVRCGFLSGRCGKYGVLT